MRYTQYFYLKSDIQKMFGEQFLFVEYIEFNVNPWASTIIYNAGQLCDFLKAITNRCVIDIQTYFVSELVSDFNIALNENQFKMQQLCDIE